MVGKQHQGLRPSALADQRQLIQWLANAQDLDRQFLARHQQARHQQLTFPLHLVEDEFHAVHLRLGVPSIFEDGPMIRPWRLALETPVALENIKGYSSALWVHEVSFKGVLVEVRGRVKPPKTFSLWFSPSGYERIALRGTLERVTARGLFAYRLSQSDADEIERLRQFILHQHRLVHPHVHA